MSESSTHNSFVIEIYEYVKKRIEPDDLVYLKADVFNCEKPSLTYDDFVPDVYFCNGKHLIIGEAKTLDDFKTEHSYKQFESYVNECSMFAGDSEIIVYVPWQLFITAQNHFAYLRKKTHSKFKIIVLADNGAEVII